MCETCTHQRSFAISALVAALVTAQSVPPGVKDVALLLDTATQDLPDDVRFEALTDHFDRLSVAELDEARSASEVIMDTFTHLAYAVRAEISLRATNGDAVARAMLGEHAPAPAAIAQAIFRSAVGTGPHLN